MSFQHIKHVSDSFTRPANTTAYSAGDLVADTVTAGSVVPLKFNIGEGGFQIVEWHCVKSGTGVTNADFDLHLYGSAPTLANGDNGAWSTDLSDYIGTIAGGQLVAFTDGAANVNALALGLALGRALARDRAAIVRDLDIPNALDPDGTRNTARIRAHAKRVRAIERVRAIAGDLDRDPRGLRIHGIYSPDREVGCVHGDS